MGRPRETADLVSISKIDLCLSRSHSTRFAFQEGTQWHFRKSKSELTYHVI